MVKGHDVVILIQLLKSARGDELTYRDLGELCGISQSQVFDSLERCFEVGLIDKDRRLVRKDRLLEFLQHSLPYVFPSKVGGPCVGIPLAMQAMAFQPPNKVAANVKLVWRVDETTASTVAVEGFGIEPMVRNLSALLQRDPELVGLLSCIEILRLVDHPFRSLALQQVEEEIEKVFRSQPVPPSSIENATVISEAALEVATRYIAKHGFNAVRFESIAPIMNVSESALREMYLDEERLVLAMIDRVVQVVGRFLGPFMLRERVTAEDLLKFVDGFWDYLESNEDFHRLIHWAYLEDGNTEVRKAFARSFDLLLNAMAEKISDVVGPLPKEEAMFRAYLLSGCIQWYAILVWDESPKIADRSVLPFLRSSFKRYMRETVMKGAVLQGAGSL